MRPRKIILRSQAALFGKTLETAPTPWISSSHIDPASGDEIALKYRLWVRRRGKALHVETHAESPTLPGIIKAVHMSRSRFFEFYEAGMALVACARWDHTRPPTHPRPMWDVNARHYPMRLEHARLVSSAIPRFLEPRVGRPRKDAAATDPVNPNMPIALRGGGRAAARRARRNDLLLLTEKINNIIEPMGERMGDSRRMGGYIGAEQQRLYQMVQILRLSNRSLRDAVFFDKIIENETEPAANRMSPASVLVRGPVPEGFTLDVDLPTTPEPMITEQEIDEAIAAAGQP